MTEKKFRALVIKLLTPIAAFPVENVVHDGVPDVCCVAGFIELKVAARPKRDGTRINAGLRPAQRIWMRRWRLSGGRAWTLTLLGETWMLHDADWSASYMDRVDEEEFTRCAVAVWNKTPDHLELIQSLTKSLPRIN